MVHIRLAMQQGSIEKLSGHFDIDETCIGGKAHDAPPTGAKDPQPQPTTASCRNAYV